MPDRPKNDKSYSSDDIVEETHHLFDIYSKERDVWARNAKEDKEFRLGRQWTREQEEVLKARGQAPIVVNRIHPAVEAAKAMLTSNRPAFRVAPREDSDNKTAQVISALLSYMYDISDGTSVVRQTVDDYYTMGVGYINVYQDPMMDMGKGEVCMHNIDPLDVYVDPNCRDRFLDDAENIIISRMYTKAQAEKMYPMYKTAIENAASDNRWDEPDTGRSLDGYAVTFPEDVQNVSDQEYIRGYERYYKLRVPKFRVYENFSGNEDLLSEEDFNKYISQPAWILNGEKVLVDPAQVQALMQQFAQQQAQLKETQRVELAAQGQDPNTAEAMPMPELPIEEVNFEILIQRQFIEVVKVQVERVKHCVVMGDKLLYSRILPTEGYPIVAFMNIHTRTPYPTSDVRMVKGLQEFINKTRSLIIAHATTSTNVKILVPEGSVDMKNFEEKWSQPGVAISYDPTDGPPMPVQPSPLPNELYNNETTAKSDIDHQLGLYEMMMGNTRAAPQTYKATISLDEFGQRKMKSKLADIEAGLTRVAQVAIPLMQQLYTTQKTFRIVQPNNSLSEYTLNKKLVDDKSQEIQIFNNIMVGKYDVVYVAGSTLPTNRYAELEFYMDAFAKGLIDRQEVLKKTEIFDMEGVLERIDVIAQLQQQLQGSQEQIKKLQGDLQTRDREAVNLRKKVEVEKFKGELDSVSTKSKAAGNLYEQRLDDSLSTIKRDIALSTQEAKKTASPSKDKEAGKK